MKTKRLTLESFKSVVKRIIKEEMYRTPEEKSSIEMNDLKKSRELEINTIDGLKIKVNINRGINNSLQIIVNSQIQDYLFNYDENYGFRFNKKNERNILSKQGAIKFLDIIYDALDYMQVDKSKMHMKERMIIGFLTNYAEGQNKIVF
jgi:hypothetical protein